MVLKKVVQYVVLFLRHICISQIYNQHFQGLILSLGVNNAFLTLVEDIGLQQMVDFPTRNSASMDLFLTNRPSLINHLKPIPEISKHEALFIDSEVQTKLRMPTSRKIFL